MEKLCGWLMTWWRQAQDEDEDDANCENAGWKYLEWMEIFHKTHSTNSAFFVEEPFVESSWSANTFSGGLIRKLLVRHQPEWDQTTLNPSFHFCMQHDCLQIWSSQNSWTLTKDENFSRWGGNHKIRRLRNPLQTTPASKQQQETTALVSSSFSFRDVFEIFLRNYFAFVIFIGMDYGRL